MTLVTNVTLMDFFKDDHCIQRVLPTSVPDATDTEVTKEPKSPSSGHIHQE